MTGEVVFLVVWIWIAHSATAYDDVCENESFNPVCDDKDHVILITEAKYGRMQPMSRCITKSYGIKGCGSDVTNMTSRRCSGRRSCTIPIPEPEFSKAPTDCPEDLKPYLQVSYKCVHITSPLHICPSGAPVKPTSPSGFLAGSVALHTNCGTDTTPWLIQSKSGQQILLTLYDFGGVSRPSPHGHCMADVEEESRDGVKNTRICGGTGTERLVLKTQSTKVKVILRNYHQTDNNGQNYDSYLLRYQVTGCPDVSHIPANSYVIRSENDVTFKCNFSSTEVKHKCHGHKWMGPVINCSTGPTYMEQENIPFEVSILIVIIIALVIGLVVLMMGLFFLKRQHNLCYSRPSQPPEYGQNKDYMTTSYYQTSTYAAKPPQQQQQQTNISEMPPCTPLMGQTRESPYCASERLACGCPVYMTRDELQNQQNIHNQAFPPCTAKLSTNAADVLSNCPSGSNSGVERAIIGPDMLPMNERQLLVSTLDRSPKRLAHTTFKPPENIGEGTLPARDKDIAISNNKQNASKAKEQTQRSRPLLKHNSDGSGDPSDSEASAFMPRH